MDRPNIVEKTEDEVLAQYTDAFFRRVRQQTPEISASYDGKYVVLCAVAIDINATELQMDNMEASIEAITGVHKAFVMIGPARIPIDRVPTGHALLIDIDAGFSIEPTP